MIKKQKTFASPLLHMKLRPIPASLGAIPICAPLPTPAERPPIPRHIKREVRKRCGFGCVVCGCPLYDYEHMEEWAVVKRHVADEITLLCTLHHREKTNGLLAKSVVKKRNLTPANLLKGTSKPHFLHIYGTETRLAIGGTYFFYDKTSSNNGAIVLSISNCPVLGFRLENENLLLNFILFDDQNWPILQIVDNELVYSTQIWDITFIGTCLTIRSARGKILLVLRIEANEALVTIERAELRYDGYEVRIDEEGLTLPGSLNGLHKCQLLGSGWMMNVGGISGMGAAMHFVGKRTYGPMKE
jgi:hypothetical protein